LHGQFILTTREDTLPRGWEVLSHGRWTLAYCQPLGCVSVRDPRGVCVGWVIGHAVTEKGEFLHPRATPELRVPQDASFREVVDRLTGRFIAIDLADTAPLLHPDATASLSAVFSPEEETVASTNGLIPVSPSTPYEVEWILATDIPYTDALYPVGLTPRRGVERVLPNHILDLAQWKLRRVWPVGPWARDIAPDTAVEIVRQCLTSTIRAIGAVYDLDFSLTAGWDSRMMFACSRGVARTTLFTADLGDEASSRDITVARSIAERCATPHRLLSWRRPRRRELRQWVVRTGGEAGELRGMAGCRTLAGQLEGRASITGAVANLSKTSGWRQRYLTKEFTPANLLGLCGVIPHPDFVRRAEDWFSSLPRLDSLALADIAHIEQRNGCWAGVIEYGELGQSSARLCPASSRAINDASVRLPIDFRMESGLHRGVIAAAWNELLEFPFNEGAVIPSFQHRILGLQRRLGRPLAPLSRALRKARASPEWLREKLLNYARGKKRRR
jgi:hypothetical protein